MATEPGTRNDDTVIEAVAVFHDVTALDEAVEDLRKAGFKHGDISLLASEDAVEKKLGHRYERVEDLEDDPNAPRIAYRTRDTLGDTEGVIVGSLTYLPAVLAAGTVVASTGIVAAAVTGTAIAGALIGTVLTRWLGEQHARQLAEQLDHGGLLLWVRTHGRDQEEEALRILRDHGGADVHLHQLPARP
jgi:outer membrane lipoprotein SlyB